MVEMNKTVDWMLEVPLRWLQYWMSTASSAKVPSKIPIIHGLLKAGSLSQTVFLNQSWGLYVRNYKATGTVDGRNPANQLVGSLSHYLHGLYLPSGAGFLPSTACWEILLLTKISCWVHSKWSDFLLQEAVTRFVTDELLQEFKSVFSARGNKQSIHAKMNAYLRHCDHISCSYQQWPFASIVQRSHAIKVFLFPGLLFALLHSVHSAICQHVPNTDRKWYSIYLYSVWRCVYQLNWQNFPIK